MKVRENKSVTEVTVMGSQKGEKGPPSVTVEHFPLHSRAVRQVEEVRVFHMGTPDVSVRGTPTEQNIGRPAILHRQ